jgi:Ca2+-transporting ATPase
LFTVGIFTNRFLVGAALLSLATTVAVIQYEPLANIFHTVPLSWQDWLVALGVSLTLLPVVELTKLVLRRGQVRQALPSA